MGELVDAVRKAEQAQQRAAIEGRLDYPVQLKIGEIMEGQHSVLVSVVVKAGSKETAEAHITSLLNRWIAASPDAPFIDGDLLHWNFYEPLVVNGR